MRITHRILAICSAAALAVLGTMAIGSADAQAARPQGQEARPAAVRPPAAARPASTAQARPAPLVRPPAYQRAALPKPTPTLRAAQSGKPRVALGAPTSKSGNIKSAKLRVAGTAFQHSWGGISCVPFARAATGMSVKGNAHAWWDSAIGTYERGQRPEAGSVLNFRATSRMRLGHVAVVARVVDSRTIEIDHANWAGPGGREGRVARGVPVIDVSPGNDWSAVQVGLIGGGFGSVYPTFGFIYDRPDRGVMVANTLSRQPASGQARGRYSEVAEAWSTRVTHAQPASGFVDAPQRSLR